MEEEEEKCGGKAQIRTNTISYHVSKCIDHLTFTNLVKWVFVHQHQEQSNNHQRN